MVLNRVNAGNRGIGSPTTAGVGFHSKRIQAGLSTQIVIQVEEAGQKFAVGAIQSLVYNQNRPLVRIQEVGTDGVIGIVPQGATTHDLSINRMVFDFQRLPQALQREYRHIHSQRRPFNIVVTDYNPYLGEGDVPTGGDTNNEGGGGGAEIDPVTGSVSTDVTAVETTFRNCWFQTLNFTYNANDYLITEAATLWCEHVYDSVSAKTYVGARDALERNSSTSDKTSIMSAFDATRTE